MPNRLAGEASPYLQQHANNPVDWYPWGTEALARARAEDKPILLSIGYAACHWCHVMAHESFEDAETARLMNELYVSIKVDREERPDLDSIYMQAVQALTGHGGWPMTVFLEPDGRPFYGGTYYPPDERHGLPSFRRVLTAVADTWKHRRAAVEDTAKQIHDLLVSATVPEMTGDVTAQSLENAFRMLSRVYDERHGGFGGAPKFPPTMTLDFLLRYWARTGEARALAMTHDTYRAMVRGGVFDQVGGGLHRYSVDERWLVPHFEKMLYDNALFIRLGAHLWQATGDLEVRHAVESTTDWLLREMRAPDGGFYSSLDADSEGEEGRFYVWTDRELGELLGGQAPAARAYWGVTPEGNFDGKNVLYLPNEPRAIAARLGVEREQLDREIDGARAVLLRERGKRARPGRDEKIVAAWNGLALRALAEAARVLGRTDLRRAALECGDFLHSRLVHNGRVTRTLREDRPGTVGFLEDQAAVGLGFLDLYALTFDTRWFDRAIELAKGVRDWFYDEQAGLLFDTARDHESLITRPRDVMDNAAPSGNSLAAELLFRTAEYAGDEGARTLAERVVAQSAGFIGRYAVGFGHLLCVADAVVFGPPEVAIAGEPASEGFQSLAGRVARHYLPSLVLAGGVPSPEDQVALLRDRRPLDGEAQAYVCRRYVCDSPTTDPDSLDQQLEGAPAAR